MKQIYVIEFCIGMMDPKTAVIETSLLSIILYRITSDTVRIQSVSSKTYISQKSYFSFEALASLISWLSIEESPYDYLTFRFLFDTW